DANLGSSAAEARGGANAPDATRARDISRARLGMGDGSPFSLGLSTVVPPGLPEPAPESPAVRVLASVDGLEAFNLRPSCGGRQASRSGPIKGHHSMRTSGNCRMGAGHPFLQGPIGREEPQGGSQVKLTNWSGYSGPFSLRYAITAWSSSIFLPVTRT